MKTKLLILSTFLAPYCLYSQVNILFNTASPSSWTVTGGGAQNATPYIVNYAEGSPPVNYNFLSVTSTGDSTGSFVQGGSLSSFTGFWLANYTFYLPSNAQNVSLTYNNFFADDRAVLTLNGQTIGATGIISIQGAPGEMVFNDGGNIQPYSFSGEFSSGGITSGFNVGGLNTIEAIVNNTGTGIYGSDRNISPGDTAFLGVSGTISYIVPEPSALALLGIGIFSMIKIQKRK
jgi:hypothetical protein